MVIGGVVRRRKCNKYTYFVRVDEIIQVGDD